MNTTELPELGLTDEQMNEVRELALGSLPESEEVDLPEGTRQILFVSGHTLISSNFVESQITGKVGSNVVLLLKGKASPSSNPLLYQAYITFMDDTGKLRRPGYSQKKGTLWLYMPLRMLPVVLAQIHETNVVCWIGHFAGGHIWADIHTSH